MFDEEIKQNTETTIKRLANLLEGVDINKLPSDDKNNVQKKLIEEMMNIIRSLRAIRHFNIDVNAKLDEINEYFGSDDFDPQTATNSMIEALEMLRQKNEAETRFVINEMRLNYIEELLGKKSNQIVKEGVIERESTINPES